MAGENRQDFNRPSKERMTEQKQEAERELNIGSDKTQQQEQHGQRPQRKPGERQHPPGEAQGQSVLQQHGEQQARARDSQQASGDVQQNIGPGESERPLAQDDGPGGAPFQPRGRYRKTDH